ncbi:hypothetical protein PTKIN_Ptkin03bG0128400 [Pterospermum kingtungense]
MHEFDKEDDENAYGKDFVDARNTDFNGTKEVSTSASGRRPRSSKRAKSVERDMDLVEHLTNFYITYQQGVNEFSTYSRKEFEVSDKLKELLATLEKMEGFTRAELVKVRAHISKKEWKVKYFFALSDESRLEFVKFQLE